MVEFFIENRWAAPLVWVVLHSLDYFLTVATIRLHRQSDAYDVGGSLELNPLMRGGVEGKRTISWRFVISLVAVAAILWLGFEMASEAPEMWQFLVGSLLFTRVSVIANHLRNIVQFRAMRDGRITGKLTLQRRTALALSAMKYGGDAALLLLAALLSGSWFLWGGAAVEGALVAVIAVRALLMR